MSHLINVCPIFKLNELKKNDLLKCYTDCDESNQNDLNNESYFNPFNRHLKTRLIPYIRKITKYILIKNFMIFQISEIEGTKMGGVNPSWAMNRPNSRKVRVYGLLKP